MKTTTIQLTDGRVVPFSWKDCGYLPCNDVYATRFTVDGQTFWSHCPRSMVENDHGGEKREKIDGETLLAHGAIIETIDFDHVSFE